MSNPQMTVKQLYDELHKLLVAGHGKLPVAVWLPGSRIDLASVAGVHTVAHSKDKSRKEVLIEGNLREGSVLS